MEEKQNQIVMCLALSLSFCAELVSSMVHVEGSEALDYKVRVRHVIDRVIAVATDNAMNRASLAPLAYKKHIGLFFEGFALRLSVL